MPVCAKELTSSSLTSSSTKKLAVLATVAIAAMFASPGARAGGPIALTEGQLDHVTAGAVVVAGTALSTATGFQTFTQTNTGAGVAYSPNTSNTGNDFGSYGGLVVSAATAESTNGAAAGAAPATQSATAQTAGGADGNFTRIISGSGTVTTPWSTTTVSMTYAYGALVPPF
jgi:hypothetical protein